MKRDVAEQLQFMALTVDARMRETLDYAFDRCSEDEAMRIALVAGSVISAPTDNILAPIPCVMAYYSEADRDPQLPRFARFRSTRGCIRRRPASAADSGGVRGPATL